MITAIAIDDELPALKLIENYCAQIDFISLEKIFNRPYDGLTYANNYPVDLLFLDINMPLLNGIDLLKAVNRKTMVVFTTAYSEYAVEGFALQAIDYLLKPFSFERFVQAVTKANEYYRFSYQSGTAEPYIFVRAEYSLTKIQLDNILFIEGLGDYIKIHLSDQKPVIARITLKVLAQKLPPHLFVRVHRSYIVSIKYIESVRNKIITVKAFKIPVSASYEDELQKWLKG